LKKIAQQVHVYTNNNLFEQFQSACHPFHSTENIIIIIIIIRKTLKF